MDLTLVYCKCERFVEKAIGDEKVLVPLSDNVADMNKVYNLNQVAAFIYDSMDGQTSLGDIHTTLINHYEVAEEEALNDIKHFVADMVSRGVIFAKQ